VVKALFQQKHIGKEGEENGTIMGKDGLERGWRRELVRWIYTVA
jgi:hypothetical protein